MYYSFSKYQIVLLIHLLFIFSCSPKSEKQDRPFEFYFDFEKEIIRLEEENPVIKKTVTKNEGSETITDAVNWKNELSFFSSSDINKPHFKDSYEIETLVSGNEKKVRYIAKENKLPVRLVEISFSGNEATRVYILKEVNNVITKSKYELTYFPNNKYSINGSQVIPYFYEENFFIEGIFLSPKTGKWRAALKIKTVNETEEIPFQFNLNKKSGKFSMEILNAEEKIVCDEITFEADSIFIRMPVFDSGIKGKFVSDTLIEGAWFNYSKGSDYIVPFYAEYGKPYRFKINSKQHSNTDISGKWSVEFSPGKAGHYAAIGIFRQNGKDVTGTFLTETGDYRFLEGAISNDTLLLSCFDGSHAFLFSSILENSKMSNGNFWSGTHWQEPWIAYRNDKAKLSDPDSLTFLKKGYDKISFSFPDMDSNIVSLSDKKFQNKVVIIQIMGSWCPNCLDETVFLSELYKNEHEKGLEIIGLSFERNQEFNKAKQAVKRFKEQLNAPYYFLIAGTASTAKANEALPMLNNIMSFPTTIFIDRTGKVRKIHTGFNGPGTGEYYENYKKETMIFLEKLLRE